MSLRCVPRSEITGSLGGGLGLGLGNLFLIELDSVRWPSRIVVQSMHPAAGQGSSYTCRFSFEGLGFCLFQLSSLRHFISARQKPQMRVVLNFFPMGVPGDNACLPTAVRFFQLLSKRSLFIVRTSKHKIIKAYL